MLGPRRPTVAVRVPWRAGFLAVLSLLAAACGGQGEGGGEAEPAAPGPSRGGVVRILQEISQTLDPMAVSSVYEALLADQLFDGLVAVGPNLQIVPGLADTWTISKDNLEYTFHLRPGVRFHDGSECDAEDVAFTIRRVLLSKQRPRSIAFSYLGAVAGAMDFAEGRRSDLPGVETPDTRTVRIRLERPYLSFLEVLAMDGLRVVPRHVVERTGDEAFARSPVGTGPFRLESWDASGIRIVANAAYFGGPPHLDAVEILFRRDGEVRIHEGRFERGEVDVFSVGGDELRGVRSDPRLKIFRYHELSLMFFGLRTSAPPLDDVRVRQAIAHAIDREAIVKMSPLRRTAVGILPPGMPAYSPSVKALAHDPARARKLLAEAGHPGGADLLPVRFLMTPAGPLAEALYEKFRSDLADVGIPVEFEQVTWPELSRKVDEHAAPAFTLGWTADLHDPDTFLRTLFLYGTEGNIFELKDERCDTLLEAGAREMNPVERNRIYREAEQRILELAPIVPLFHSVGTLGVRSGIHGIEPGPLGLAGVDFENVWIDSGGGGA